MGLGALALVGAGDTAVSVGVRLVALAFVFLVAGVVLGWAFLIPVSLVSLGAAYAIHLYVDDPGLEARAPLLAAGLVLTAELGYWSLEEREYLLADPGDRLRRLGFVLLLGLGALAVGALPLAVADLARTSGLAVDLLGAAAAAAALLVVVLTASGKARRD